MAYDTIIINTRWFDGTGAPSAMRHLGLRDGRVAAVSTTELDPSGAEVIDAGGAWVMPGFVDIHTHYDAEVLVAPALNESVRHGVTTVFLGSCSLSTVHVDDQDGADLFSRVEALPRDHVLAALGDKSWSTAAEYVAALESLPLGPNIAGFIGHSDIRVGVMGLERATDSDTQPTSDEIAQMERMLTEALDAGMVGMSESNSPWDKLDGRLRSRVLPSVYARRTEIRRLHGILRRRRRVLQSVPDLAKPIAVIPALLRSIRRQGKPLRTTCLTAADVKANPLIARLFGPVTRAINRLGGDFRWQHLPVPFKVFADGIDLVIFEEFGAGAAALHLTETVARNQLLRDDTYRRRFRKQYESRFTPRVWHRDFFDAHIVACPDPEMVGLTFGQVANRLGIHPADAFLDLVVEYGTSIRWHTTVSNHRADVLDRLSDLPEVQMGFSDAGAHLRNMAFYNFPLQLLNRAASTGFMTVERAVHRLTGELATWYGIDAGFLREGDRADLVIIDPEHLPESVSETVDAPMEGFGDYQRMANRNDNTVIATLVAGNVVYRRDGAAERSSRARTGRFLRVGEAIGTVDPQTVHRAVAV